VEDAVSGLKSAGLAGAYTIGVVSTHTRDQLEIADFVADSLSEVENHIKELLQ
jgi:beta-phosphoglucomutase-like phosphatase (HAD superfamily)